MCCGSGASNRLSYSICS